MKRITSRALISLLKESLTPTPTSLWRRYLCTETIDAAPYHPPDETYVTGNLISLLTKRPFSPADPELKSLAPKLNAKVVESVLNGLRSWKIAHIFFIWASNQHGYRHNCYTYNAMASILSRVRQNAELRALAMDILNSNCFITPGALGFFLRCLGNVGLVEEANFMFDRVRLMGLCAPNSYSYNCLLEAISKSGSVGSIERRLKEMIDSGWEFNKYTMTTTLKAYCNAGNFEKALSIYNDMHERGWADEHVFTILVSSFSKWGEVDKAVELIERMEDHNLGLNERTFYTLIHGAVKESRDDLALYLFAKMRKSGFTPDISLYDVLIGGLCKKKELVKAMCLFSQMKELGIIPDVGILTKLISACSEESDVMKLLEERQEDMDDEAMILLYNSVLNCLVNSGSIDKAYKFLMVMSGNTSHSEAEGTFKPPKKKISLNTTSFGIVIDGLLKAGKLDTAINLFEQTGQLGCEKSLLLYNNLINTLCDSDRIEESHKLVRDMKESGLQPTHFTHNSLFGCLCRREDVSGATELVKEMKVHGHEPWIKHLTLLVKKLCKHGRAMEACNFLADMVQVGFLPDIIAYSAAIDGLIRIQKLDQALQMFQDISARSSCPDVVAYNTLINGLCKAGRVMEAQEFLNEMIVKGLIPSPITYNVLIDGWCKTGNIDQAMLCLSRMIGENREPTVVTYTTLVDGLCNAGRPDEAVTLWNEMEQKGYAPNRVTYMALIYGLCKCGRPDSAQLYFHKMEEKEMKPDIYVHAALLNSFIADLNYPMGFEILKKMVDKGNTPDPTNKNYVAVRDAIFKLSEDARTSSRVRDLIAEGRIPTISVSDLCN